MFGKPATTPTAKPWISPDLPKPDAAQVDKSRWLSPAHLKAVAAKAKSNAAGTAYSLHRTSLVPGVIIKFASFGPNGESAAFNKSNCEFVKRLIDAQNDAVVKFWCVKD